MKWETVYIQGMCNIKCGNQVSPAIFTSPFLHYKRTSECCIDQLNLLNITDFEIGYNTINSCLCWCDLIDVSIDYITKIFTERLIVYTLKAGESTSGIMLNI